MISYHRLFQIYRAMAHSFDSYLRTLEQRRIAKGFKRLQKDLNNYDDFI